MEYCIGHEDLTKETEVLKTIDKKHTNYNGETVLTMVAHNELIVDSFYVIKKIRMKEDTNGNCYDWYEIKNHYQYVDSFSKLRTKFEKADEENDTAVFDIAEVVDENSNAIYDLAEYIGELEERIAELEGSD